LIIAVAVGLLAFGVYLWQLSDPELISFYDTGVYTAATIHFVSGALPYRDFTFVNPPGIVLLLSPIGLVARIFGSHDGLIVGRVFTSLVTALNASLLAWLVRHRGRVAMIIAGVGLALLPVTFFVSSDVKLDPYSIFFVLLGSIAVFSQHNDEGSGSSRILIVGGILFGVSGGYQALGLLPVSGTAHLHRASLPEASAALREWRGRRLHCSLPAIFHSRPPKLHLSGLYRAASPKD
jgi:4-amino-4-deoxy-L-arabinose transferase-like glycosyltransferase